MRKKECLLIWPLTVKQNVQLWCQLNLGINYSSMYPERPQTHARRYTVEYCDNEEDVCTFWAIELDYKDKRIELENLINDKYARGELNSIYGRVQLKQLVLAPYEGSYHRAIVLKARFLI